MFSRIDRARFRPEHRDDVVRVAKESLDTFRAIPGFRGITYHYDPGSGWGFAVSLWASEAEANAAGDHYATVADAFADYAVGESNDDPARSEVIGPLPAFQVVVEA